MQKEIDKVKEKVRELGQRIRHNDLQLQRLNNEKMEAQIGTKLFESVWNIAFICSSIELAHAGAMIQKWRWGHQWSESSSSETQYLDHFLDHFTCVLLMAIAMVRFSGCGRPDTVDCFVWLLRRKLFVPFDSAHCGSP